MDDELYFITPTQNKGTQIKHNNYKNYAFNILITDLIVLYVYCYLRRKARG